MIRQLLVGIFLVIPFSAVAQDDHSCLAGDRCPRNPTDPYPESGIWFNRSQPGSGFMLEVQNRTLAGYYFGYDVDGRPVWYLLQGTLEPSPKGRVMWQLDSELLRFQGGNCIDCPYLPPVEPENIGDIRIEFTTRNVGHFSVDGVNQGSIQSYIFGSRAYDVFPGIQYPVPEITGQWHILYYDRETEISRGRRDFAATGFEVWIDTANIDEGEANYGLVRHGRFPEATVIGFLECDARQNGVGGRCVVSLSNPPDEPKKFFMPVTNLSDSFFKATAPDGDTIEGRRANYD